MSEHTAEQDPIVRAEMGTRSPDGQYAVVRYFTASGRMFRRTHTWARALAATSPVPPGSGVDR